MRTPEQRGEYERRARLLQHICVRYKRELPDETTSVRLTNHECRIRLKAYDKDGKPTGTLPNERTSVAFLNELAHGFGNATSLDPEGVIASV
jgi:hypothetical protein